MSEAAHQSIRTNSLTGVLLPRVPNWSSLLPNPKLSAKSVNEALARLVRERLATCLLHCGYFVRTLTPEDIEQT